MKTVIIPRGIPGSGKTTWVKEQLAQHPPGTAVRISNDDLSFMLYGQPWGTFFFSDTTRETLAELRVAMLTTFLKQDGITHIYIDNTNLAVKTVRSLEKVAQQYDAEVIIYDNFLAVPIEECVARDATREKPVGEDVIRKMHKDAARLKPWKPTETVPVQKYDNDQSGASYAIIVDIDGTLAHMGDRGPYDWHRVGEDLVDPGVRSLVNKMHDGTQIIIMSGRDGSCMHETYRWLEANDIKFDLLLMRNTGDMRPDWIVKYELFQEHVAGKHRIRFVLDDRNSVVDLWRNRLGLPTYQVAEGDF